MSEEKFDDEVDHLPHQDPLQKLQDEVTEQQDPRKQFAEQFTKISDIFKNKQFQQGKQYTYTLPNGTQEIFSFSIIDSTPDDWETLSFFDGKGKILGKMHKDYKGSEEPSYRFSYIDPEKRKNTWVIGGAIDKTFL